MGWGMNCSMFVVWGILIITATISLLLYDVTTAQRHLSVGPYIQRSASIGPYKHSVHIRGCMQPP